MSAFCGSCGHTLVAVGWRCDGCGYMPPSPPVKESMSTGKKVALGVLGGYLSLMVLGGLAAGLDEGDRAYTYVPSGPNGTSGSSSSGNDTPSCRFLRASLADFLAPNPPPITDLEQVEYAAIRSQMTDEGC
jgi:hypothetical protein